MGTSELLVPIWRSRGGLPFQEALDDLVVPTAHLPDRPSTATFMDTIISTSFARKLERLVASTRLKPGRSDNYGLDGINCLRRNRTIVALRTCQKALAASMGDVRESVVPVGGRPRY